MTADTIAGHMLESGSLPPRTRLAKLLGETGLIVILCVGVLAPALTLTPTWPQIRTETVMLLAYAAVYGWLLLAGLAKPVRLHAFYLIGVLFSLSVMISLMYGSLILNHEVSFRDFYEIPKCWLPVFFFTIAYEAELSEQGINRLLDFFAIAVALVCLYGWAQFLDLGIAAQLNHYYSDFGHNFGGLIRYGRIFSTLGNPNSLGQLMSWTLCIYVLAFLFGVGSRVRNLCLIVMCGVTVALTSSRYGLLASGVGLLLVLGLSMSSRRRGAKLIGLAVVIVLLGPVVAQTAQSSYWAASRFEQLKNPLQVDSLRGRLDTLWLDAGGYFLSSPWVGHGPAKKLFDAVYTDSEYLDILKYYGAVGFIAYLAYYLWPLMEIFKGMKRIRLVNPDLEESLSANVLVIRAGFTIFCLALFMNVGEFTLYNSVLLAFLWLWAGLAVRASHFVMEVAAQDSISGVTWAPRFRLARDSKATPFRIAVRRLDPLHD